MAGDVDWLLLERWFAGECSPDEAAAVRRWIDADPSHARLAATMRAAWERAGGAPGRRDVAAAWGALASKLRSGPPNPKRVLELVPPRRRAGIGVIAARIAAVLALAAGAGTWFVFRDRIAAPTAPAPLREIATRPGQRADVYLSDGTHVTLGAASRLRFSSPLGKSSREVHLEGEALFEVTHDPKWPFLVRTAHAVTEDLGTKFAMRAYAADSAVTVAVAEGKVALRRGAEPGAVLGPGDLGRLTRDGRVRAERGVALERYLAWAEGRLVFTDVALGDVVPELARWYDLDVRFADPSLAARRLTITVTTESTEELLRYLALALDVRVERRGRGVTFYPK